MHLAVGLTLIFQFPRIRIVRRHVIGAVVVADYILPRCIRVPARRSIGALINATAKQGLITFPSSDGRTDGRTHQRMDTTNRLRKRQADIPVPGTE